MMGSLIEVAKRHQLSVEQAIERLERATAQLREHRNYTQGIIATLPAEVAGQVGKMLASAADEAAERLSEKFTRANKEAERARLSYESAARFCFRRVARHACICCFAGIAAMVITACFILPDASTIQRAREAEHRVTELASRGGNGILETCNERLCVRTDERGKPDPWRRGLETYRIMYGY